MHTFNIQNPKQILWIIFIFVYINSFLITQKNSFMTNFNTETSVFYFLTVFDFKFYLNVQYKTICTE